VDLVKGTLAADADIISVQLALFDAGANAQSGYVDT
jgi:hypothetical protein